MKITTTTDLIKILGWTTSSKLIYILNVIKQNKSKEQIYHHLVEETGLLKSKSFYNCWNTIHRFKDDIQFV